GRLRAGPRVRLGSRDFADQITTFESRKLSEELLREMPFFGGKDQAAHDASDTEVPSESASVDSVDTRDLVGLEIVLERAFLARLSAPIRMNRAVFENDEACAPGA